MENKRNYITDILNLEYLDIVYHNKLNHSKMINTCHQLKKIIIVGCKLSTETCYLQPKAEKFTPCASHNFIFNLMKQYSFANEETK